MAFNPSPYSISGDLNFGQVPGMMDYGGAYQNALGLNQQNYQHIMREYAGLTSSVLGNIQGIDASQRQAISDTYAQQSGAASQSMISRGLGNSTVQDSVKRGLLADKTKADIGLTNQTQGLYAGYQSNLGLAQLGFMNSVSAPYPNAAAYGQLWQQQGALSAYNRRQLAGAGGIGGGFMGGTRVNMPTGFGISGGGGFSGGGGGGGGGFSGGGYGGGAGPHTPSQIAANYGANVNVQSQVVNPYANWENNQEGGVESGAFDPENWQQGGVNTWQMGGGDQPADPYGEENWTGGSSGGDF